MRYTIHVKDASGASHAINGPEGRSVMEILKEHGEPIEAICGGSCSCATCHVYVDPQWYARLAQPSEDERFLLEGSSEYRAGASRLSCQIRFAPGLDGLTLECAPPG